MFHHFDHRWATFNGEDSSDYTDADKCDPCRYALPRYWVIAEEVKAALQNVSTTNYEWLIGFRNVSNTTNERTFVTSPIPLSGVGNSSPILFPTGQQSHHAAFYATLTSFVFDWITRSSMGGVNLNFYIVCQLPALPPTAFDDKSPWTDHRSIRDWLMPYILELVYTAEDLAPFAHDCGYSGRPFRWDVQRRAMLRTELDAAFFHLYGLSKSDADYILDAFPITKRKDESQYGEYRTKRLILEAYDAMADAIRTSRPFQTKLDPPPADPRCAHPAAARA